VKHLADDVKGKVGRKWDSEQDDPLLYSIAYAASQDEYDTAVARLQQHSPGTVIRSFPTPGMKHYVYAHTHHICNTYS
jgi:hypothetical protein